MKFVFFHVLFSFLKVGHEEKCNAKLITGKRKEEDKEKDPECHVAPLRKLKSAQT